MTHYYVDFAPSLSVTTQGGGSVHRFQKSTVAVCQHVVMVTLCLLAMMGGAASDVQADTPVASTYENGCGVGATPCADITIATLAQLRLLSESPEDWGATVTLTADIDAADTATWNIGDHDGDTGTPEEPMGSSPIGSGFADPFSGNFDGAGYVISNLTINRPALDYVGLFGWVAQGGGDR